MNALKQLAGYILLLLLAFVPAIIGYWFEAGSNELGMLYVGSLIWITLLWFFYRKSEGVGTLRVIGIVFLVLLTFLPALIGNTIYGADMTLTVILLAITVGWMVLAWLGLRVIESAEAYL